jgi:hypothetical protein
VACAVVADGYLRVGGERFDAVRVRVQDLRRDLAVTGPSRYPAPGA